MHLYRIHFGIMKGGEVSGHYVVDVPTKEPIRNGNLDQVVKEVRDKGDLITDKEVLVLAFSKYED